MVFKRIHTKGAPEAIGPYSQGVMTESIVITSGQLPVIPTTGNVPFGIKEQTRQCLLNIKEILAEEGVAIEQVIKTSIYMTNLDEFADINEVYAEFFSESLPARATVGVSELAKGAKIEIEAIAVRK